MVEKNFCPGKGVGVGVGVGVCAPLRRPVPIVRVTEACALRDPGCSVLLLYKLLSLLPPSPLSSPLKIPLGS